MEFLDISIMSKPLWMWGSFLAVVILLLAFDLGILNRKDTELSVKRSLKLSAFYISMGLLFGVFVYYELGSQAAESYYTGFIIEKTLSLDNIFVISLVFSYFAIPRQYQYRVLFWGIIGVILLRALLIGIGAELVHQFEWVLYVFAAFLVFTGIKMLKDSDEEPDIANNFMLKFIKRQFRVTEELHGNRFFVRKVDTATGKRLRYATPLFISLLVVEFVDVIFAVDSVPAIFAVTTDEYIVYTSNVFAILGLRALYFALAAMLHRFAYLKYSLSAVLIFIGGKVIVPGLFGLEKVPSDVSLAVTVAILAAGVFYSLHKTRNVAK
ncbi:MAG: TerC family protein [Pseudomonadota bacterium]